MGLSGRAATDLRLLRASVFAGVCVLLAAAGHQWAGGRPPGAGALVAGWLGVLAWTVPLAGRRRTVPGVAAALAAGQFALHALFCLMCASASGAGMGTVRGAGSGVLALAARLRCGALGVPLTAGQAASVVRRAGLDPAGAAAHAAHHGAAGGATTGMSMPGLRDMAGMPGMSGMSGTSARGMPGMPMSMSVPTRPGDLLHLLPSPTMALAHLAAAALLGLVLWRGDVALWLLTSRPASSALRRLLGVFADGVRALAAVAGAAEAVRRRRRAAHRNRRPALRRPRPAAAPAVRRGPPAYAVAV